MKPNDASGKLSTEQRPFRVLILAGSDRRQYNCPGVDSKARALMLRAASRLPVDWEIDYEDLGNVFGRSRIQTCNACVSTSMALCVWPCNCYEKNSKVEPDLMWDMDLYARLDLADAWAVIGPVNWYGPTSNLKAMFDRLAHPSLHEKARSLRGNIERMATSRLAKCGGIRSCCGVVSRCELGTPPKGHRLQYRKIKASIKTPPCDPRRLKARSFASEPIARTQSNSVTFARLPSSQAVRSKL